MLLYGRNAVKSNMRLSKELRSWDATLCTRFGGIWEDK